MKKLLFVVMASAIAFTFALGCEKVQMTGEQTTQEESAMLKPEQITPEKAISAATIVIGDKTWTVEVASTDEERIKGLGGRDSLAAKTGMWFLFPADAQDPFWMKDMNFPLDLVFVGSDMKVVYVKTNVPNHEKDYAYTEADYITSTAPYRYVLEVSAGEAAGVAPGTVVEYRVGPK